MILQKFWVPGLGLAVPLSSSLKPDETGVGLSVTDRWDAAVLKLRPVSALPDPILPDPARPDPRFARSSGRWIPFLASGEGDSP